MLSVYYKIKDTVNPGAMRVLACFLDDWVDTSLASDVKYSVLVETPFEKNFRIDFENQEDALFLKLIGVPDEFKKYIEISDNS